MTVLRSVPSSLSGLLGELELERPRVVTAAWVRNALERAHGDLPVDEALRRLRRLGWLLPLRVRGAWEFAPADRAGALGGGDPFIELRALAAVRPQIRVAVGYESAAFLRSLASRAPSREVIVCDQGTGPIKALGHFRRVDLTLPDEAYSVLDELRVQTPAGLLSAIAVRPAGFGDWPGLSEWLREAARACDQRVVRRLLAGRPAAAWARAAYLLHTGDNNEAAGAVLAQRPAGDGPFYLGPRRAGGVFDASTDVIDSVVAKFADAGQGRA